MCIRWLSNETISDPPAFLKLAQFVRWDVERLDHHSDALLSAVTGVGSNKLESWLDSQDEELKELCDEQLKTRKQNANDLKVEFEFGFKHRVVKIWCQLALL